MSKTLKTAKARALLRAEKARAAQQETAPQPPDLVENPDSKPTSSPQGPDGSPLYNSEQAELVENPEHQQQTAPPTAPAIKNSEESPENAELYDANPEDLTDPKEISARRRSAKRRRPGVISRIRQKALH